MGLTNISPKSANDMIRMFDLLCKLDIVDEIDKVHAVYRIMSITDISRMFR